MDFIGKKQGFIDTGVFLAMFVFSSKKRVGVFGYPCFWAENRGGFGCESWFVVRGSGLGKKRRKIEKKTTKSSKRGGKKGGNREKLKKMMQKDVQFTVCFQNRAKIPLKRRGGLSIYYSRFTIDYL